MCGHTPSFVNKKCNMDGTHYLLWVQSVTWLVHTLYCEKEAPEDFAVKIRTAVP